MKNTNQKWQFVTGGAIEPLIYKELWAQTFYECLNKDHIPRSYLIIRKDKWASEYCLGSDLSKLFTASKDFMDPIFFSKFRKSSQQARSRFQRVAKNFKAQSLNNKGLQKWFKKYLQIFYDVAVHFWASQSEFLQYPEKVLREKLSKKIKDSSEIENVLAALTTPTELTIIEKEELALAKLARDRIKKIDLENHAYKFPWLFFNTFDRDKALRFLIDRVKDIKNQSTQSRILNRKRTLRKNRNTLLRKYNDFQLNYLSSLFREMAIERFRLKACWAGATFLFLPLFEGIAKELETDKTNLLWTWRAEEIYKGLKGEGILPQQEISNRFKSYAILLDKSKIKFYSGPTALWIIKKILGKDFFKKQKVKQLKGTCASSGEAQGKVRIIRVEDLTLLSKDLKEFKKSEVMVVTMTQPNMVPIIRKAAAVITEEGGITSHAAVICRELKIPCVIGTAIATRVLRTGDLVKINAEKGIIDLI